MAKMIPASERITRARLLIQKARDLPVPLEAGRHDFSYIAQVKDIMQQARDLVKFIPYTVGVSDETKEEVKRIFQETQQAEKEILHKEG
jgi:hypothetical protein